MVSDLFVQGKPVRPVYIKTRSAGAVVKKTAKGVRSASVPIERKENIAFPSNDTLLTQPSCSHTSRQGVIPHTRTIRSGKTLKPKMKRDGFRFKSSPHEKPSKSINHIMHNMQNTNCLVRQRLKIDSTTKLNTIKEKKLKPKCGGTSETDLDRVQLREICFVKDGDGKKVIAKYTSSESKSEDYDDNLIVSWDPSSAHPTVFSQKQSVQTLIPSKSLNEPGCSKQGGFRVHNFARSGSFNKNKRSKRPLRRLAASADQNPKTDKLKKRKKAKSKIG